jgi:MFS family permease
LTDTPRHERAAAPSLSIRATLRHLPFRALLGGGSVYFVGNAMQAMAAAWSMIELTGSSFLAALVQTAVFLPMFLLALPAGVLADTTDRRRLILLALAVQAGLFALLALLVLFGWAGAATLLVLTFVAGCCTALISPSWNSAIVDVVPRDELPQAITAVGISYNAARALGPALAGFVFAHAGSGWVFVLSVFGVLALIAAVRLHPPRPHPPSRLPAERLWGGMLSGLRFVRHSEAVLAQLVRTVAYSAAGSALWALLPVIAQRQLGLGAAGFGFLIGCLGAGAVLTGFGVAWLRKRLGLEHLVALGCVLYALVMMSAALWRWAPGVYSVLLVGGGCWMAVMSTFNTATQTSVPPWVRARATAMHTLCALGSFAIGSAFWGACSDILGVAPTLVIAALAMAAGLLLARPFPLRMGELGEVTQVKATENLFIVHEPDPEAGPVAVEIGYRIRAEDADAFLDALTRLKAWRRRDGATFWRVYRDLADPSRFLERFIVTSWADYLHQRSRATVADLALEADVRAFLLPGELATTEHYIAER